MCRYPAIQPRPCHSSHGRADHSFGGADDRHLCGENLSVGEQFDRWVEVIHDPSGRQWTVEAHRPKLTRAAATLVVRSMAGVVTYREAVHPDEDIEQRVIELASRVAEEGLT